jgi:5-(carboxyamino)imidazole ribonucleotide mutase
MPGGVPVATMAIGPAGATNAGLLAVAMLARHDESLATALHSFRTRRAGEIRAIELDR